jgi:hypothetical protein
MLISTVSNEGSEYECRSGSGEGTVIAFWNHASENSILRHGFTFYYLDSNRLTGGILVEAEFEGLSVKIDQIVQPEAIFGSGEEIAITGR